MPLSIYSKLNTSMLKEIGIIIQLAYRSVVYPEGVLEDVLTQVDNLIFSADVYVLHMEDDKLSNSSDLLLGRSFHSTTKIKIYIHDGTLTMEFDGEVMKFNIYDAMIYLSDVSYVYSVDVIDSTNKKCFNLCHGDELNVVICNNLNVDNLGTLE